MSRIGKIVIAVLPGAVLLLAGCGGADPVVNFGAGDETVASGETLQWSFDDQPAGQEPEGATIFDGSWTVQQADVAESPPNELCQTETAKFPAMQLGDDVMTDLKMSARIKPLTGEEDQAAGLIFRAQDSDNYYILRANALEKNVSFYKYAGGNRSFLKEDTADVNADVWQTLSVTVTGDTMQAYFNDDLIVELEDSTFSTGYVGLWTKADSVTCFDDITVTAE